MARGTHLTALALVAGMLAIAGCGGSSKSSSTVTTATTVAATTQTSSTTPAATGELATKAGAICERLNTKRATIKIRTPQDYTRLIPLSAVYQHAALNEFSGVTPPASAAQSWKQFVAEERTIADAASKIARYVRANEASNITAIGPLLQATKSAQKQMRAIAKQLGLKGCEEV